MSNIFLIIVCSIVFIIAGIMFFMLFFAYSTIKMLVFRLAFIILCIFLAGQIKLLIEGSYGWLWYISLVVGILLPNLKYPPSKQKSKK
jgi:hypothetical protein